MAKIEKGIPFLGRNSGTYASLPYGDMEVGDSVFIPGVKISSASGCLRHHFSKHHDKKFSIRTVEGGVRFWRIA